MKCPRCSEKLTKKRHDKITPKLLKKKYIFTEHFYCFNCNYIKLLEDKKVFIDLEDYELVKKKGVKPKKIVYQEKTRKKKVQTVKAKDYTKYINSKAWARKRKSYYTRHEKQCIICKSEENLHLHHIVYSRLGNEEDEDLSCLCADCHNYYHANYQTNNKKHFKQFTSRSRSKGEGGGKNNGNL